MSWFRALFKHDYELHGPAFYNPRQRAFSLFKSVMIWVGLNLCIDVLTRAVLDRGTSFDVYSGPWLLLVWMSVGAIFWWMDKVRYESWLSNRSESSLREESRPCIEKEVQP